MKVKITKLPVNKAQFGKQVDGALSLKTTGFGGADYKKSDKGVYNKVKSTIGAVSRDDANLEAEGGETAFGPISGQSIPDHLKIVGKRHHEGGVPLNLPDDTFVFSDTAALKINDPAILSMFNRVPKKGGYTPAELAKPYDINKFKEILYDPDSSKLEKNTATIMIKNYIMKLGALALVQESMKGFPQGIPEMARPYMEANGINEEDLIPELKEQADAMAQQMPQQESPEQESMEQMPDNEQAEEGMYPEQMPSGAPVASPEALAQMQGMPPQGMMPPQQEMMPPQGMMAYGGIPNDMVQYGGFAYGDYAIPTGYYNNGGLVKAQGGLTINYDDPTVKDEIAKQWSGDKARYTAYKKLEYKLKNDPNLKQQLYDEYKRIIEEDKQYTSGSKSNYYGALKDRKADFVLQALLDQERRNRILQAATEAHPDWGYRAKESGQRADTRNKYLNQKTLDFINAHPELGLKEEDFQRGHVSQAAYIAYDELMKRIDPEGRAKHFGQQTGVADERGNTQISGIDNASTDTTLEQYVYGMDDEPVVEGSPKEREKVCKCKDPKTGQVTETIIPEGQECKCSGIKQEMVIPRRYTDYPHWSIPDKRNVFANLFMRTEPAATNAVLPGRTQVRTAYEEYKTKVDTALAAQNQIANALMYGVSGSSGTKQAQLKDLLGKALRQSTQDVADVTSRNAEREGQFNIQSATIDNTNELARASSLKEALDAQALRRDTKTANVNKKLYNVAQSMSKADEHMAKVQNANKIHPQYNLDYDYNFIHGTGVEKPLTGEVTPGFQDRVDYWTEYHGGDRKAGFDAAWKEARLKSKYGGEYAKGGYILASNVFPFIL